MAALKAWQQMRLFWNLVAWPLGVVLAAASWLVRLTTRVHVHGKTPSGPCVYVSWHRHVPFLIIHHGRAHRWQLMSPAPYLLPIVRWSQLMGMRCMQAPYKGRLRDAFPRMAEVLRQGGACAVYVDGPTGPARQAKVGCVELARAANVPLVPIAYRTTFNVTAQWRWDHALFALPFERVDVYVGAHISPASDDAQGAAQLVALGDALDALGVEI